MRFCLAAFESFAQKPGAGENANGVDGSMLVVREHRHFTPTDEYDSMSLRISECVEMPGRKMLQTHCSSRRV